MARWLRSLFRESTEARARGVSLSQLRDERSERAERAALSRRGFLVGAGASASGAMVLGAGSVARATSRAQIAIVGGGISGLACALELADAGVASTVYEASGRIGGRIFSNRAWADGQVSEWGGEFIDTGHRTMRRLARRFGLPLDNLLAAEPPRSHDAFYFFGERYSVEDAERDFRAVFPVIDADATAVGYPTSYDAYTAEGAALDAMSIYDYIERTIPGGHGSPLGMLLDIAYQGEYGADSIDQSALNLLYLLAYQPTGSGFSTFGESDEKYRIRGGNDQLPAAIAAALGSRAVRTSHRLARIETTSGRRYCLSFETGGRTTDIIADHVVLALPFAVLRTLDYRRAGFDALKDEAIRELGRGRNGKLQLQFRDRYWTTRGPWGIGNGNSYSDTGYANSWEVTRAQAGTRGILNLFSGGSMTSSARTSVPWANQTRSDVRADARDGLMDLEPVFPGISSRWTGNVTHSLWHLSPDYRLSYSYWRVGQYLQFAGYEAVRQGNVYFAGEHTSTDFQGFMEGGAAEGQRAAQQVLRRI
jgi:monoamine oxidase